MTGFVAAHGIRLPVVNDSGGVNDNALANSWGIRATPTLVMLDASGAVAAIRLGPVSANELDQMYTALSAGEPIPAADATPAPSESR